MSINSRALQRKFNEILLLARKQYGSEAVENELKRQNLPAKAYGRDKWSDEMKTKAIEILQSMEKQGVNHHEQPRIKSPIS